MLHDGILNLADACEEVTLKRCGSSLSRTVPAALRRRSNLRDQTQGLKLIEQQWCTWYLPVEAEAMHPRIGDEIHDAAETIWHVTKIDLSAIPGTLRCSAYAFDVNFRRDDYVDLYRKSRHVESLATSPWCWSVFQTGLPAKLSGSSVVTNSTKVDANTRTKTVTETRTLALRGPLELEASDRFRTAEGVFYQIREIHYPQHECGWIEILLEKALEQQG